MPRKNGWGLAGFVFVAAWILGFLFETGAPALSASPQEVLAFDRAHLKGRIRLEALLPEPARGVAGGA